MSRFLSILCSLAAYPARNVVTQISIRTNDTFSNRSFHPLRVNFASDRSNLLFNSEWLILYPLDFRGRSSNSTRVWTRGREDFNSIQDRFLKGDKTGIYRETKYLEILGWFQKWGERGEREREKYTDSAGIPRKFLIISARAMRFKPVLSVCRVSIKTLLFYEFYSRYSRARFSRFLFHCV